MKILIIGTGVIGTIFGWCLGQSGNEIIHLIKKGKVNSQNEIKIDLLDVRKTEKYINDVYIPKICSIEQAEIDNYDLVIVPIKHYQLIDFLRTNLSKINASNYLLLTHGWNDFNEISDLMKGKKYIFGDAKAGGYIADGKLVGTIKGIDYGEVGLNSCLSIIDDAFELTGLKITKHKDMISYLYIEYALNAGSWPIIFMGKSVSKAVSSIPLMYKGFKSTKECLEVVKKRGVNLDDYPETKVYYIHSKLIIMLGILYTSISFRKNKYYKRNMVHSINGAEEAIHFYKDLITTGSELNVHMPIMESYKNMMNSNLA